MFGWNFLGDWFKGNSNLNTVNVENDQIVLPYDYDHYEWWNPFDLAGNYDKSIDDYNARKSSENQNQNRIYFYIASGLLALFLIKK